MTHAELQQSDCLFLPRGWHHHVFSEADPISGSNVAVNIWVHGGEASGVLLEDVQRLAAIGLDESVDQGSSERVVVVSSGGTLRDEL